MIPLNECTTGVAATSIIINTKKAFKKLYIIILRRFGLFLIHLQSKNVRVVILILDKLK